MEKHRCEATVFGGRVQSWQCARDGKLNEDGKWWCKQHAPSTQADKAAKWSAQFEAQRQNHKIMEERCDALSVAIGAQVSAYYLENARMYSETHAIVPIEWLERMAKERAP